jgi:hypothetical protein
LNCVPILDTSSGSEDRKINRERFPMRVQPFAQRRHDADAGDPDFLGLVRCAMSDAAPPLQQLEFVARPLARAEARA